MKKAIHKTMMLISTIALLIGISMLIYWLSNWTNGWSNVVVCLLCVGYVAFASWDRNTNTTSIVDPSDPRSITITPDRKIGDYCYMMGPRGIIRVRICEIKISYNTWQKNNEAYRSVFHPFRHKEHFNCDITYTVEYNGDYKNGIFPDRLYNTESDLIQHLLNNTFIR